MVIDTPVQESGNAGALEMRQDVSELEGKIQGGNVLNRNAMNSLLNNGI